MRTWAATVCLALGAATVAGMPAAIPPASIIEHIKFLASDELKGRDTGSEGLERAGDYIARQFAAIGLTPGGKGNGWFQPFDVVVGLTVGSGNRLSIEHGSTRVSLALAVDYYPLSATANDVPGTSSASLDDVPVVFAGYGLVVEGAHAYDDYAGVDVSGKAVLIFSHEPQEENPDSVFDGTRPMRETTLRAKAAAARTRGARALIVIADPVHRTDDAPYALFSSDPNAENHGIPVLRVKRSEMRAFVEAWGLDALARRIDEDLMPRSRLLSGVTVDYDERLARNTKTVRNVVGVLPGSDPKTTEAIVLGAHYDHVGLGGRLSVAPERAGEVHNGADDNASGTAAIIEIARAAAADRGRFPRTLVFVAFAAEERGLLGSARYVEDPSVPVADTVAMLNLDMVGRARGGVDVSGLETVRALEPDLEAAASAIGGVLKVRRQGPGAGRSDDASFLARGIPAINFFTGFHDDYHRPSDDWQKIDAVGTGQVATLALELAARIAARPERPVFTPAER